MTIAIYFAHVLKGAVNPPLSCFEKTPFFQPEESGATKE